MTTAPAATAEAAPEQQQQPLYDPSELLQRAAARRAQLELELATIAEQRARLEKALEVVRQRQQQAKLSSLGAASKGNITGAASKKGRGPGSAGFGALPGSGGSGSLGGAGGLASAGSLVPPPPPLNEEPAAKRARLEHERERRLNLIWQQCSTVAKTLMRHRDSAPFHRPVDPVALKCPDYLTIIKRPMDLGTALAKLEPPKSGPLGGALQPSATKRVYASPLEFRDDVRLMFANCRTYNKVGTPVRRMGDGLCDLWEKKWASSGIEQKWEAEQERARDEELEASGASAAAIRMRKLDRDLRAVNAVAASVGFGLGMPNGVPPPKPASQSERDMTFEEKRRLSQSLGMLPADKLGKALDIVADAVKEQRLAAKKKKKKAEEEEAAAAIAKGGEGAAAAAEAGAPAAAAGEKAAALGADDDEGEEIEVDIDSLPREALWALDSYALAVLPHIHGAKEKPTASAAAAAAAAATQQQQVQQLQQLAAAGANAPGAAHAAAASRGADSGSQGEVGSKGSAEGKSAF